MVLTARDFLDALLGNGVSVCDSVYDLRVGPDNVIIR